MIAPEVRRRGNRETDRRVLLRYNFLLCTAIFIVLQCWRPCFFLTDDNLDGGLPLLTEMGQHLLAGRSPFVSDYLFGGGYNLLRDAGFIIWHPLYFLTSLLAGTPLRFWIVDANAFPLLLLATAGFVNLAWYLRREMDLSISDGWITFYTASFTYSMIAMTAGACWLTFLGNMSALPWLTLGILQRSWWRGTALVAIFSIHQMLGGHPEPLVSNSLFLTLFAFGLAALRRSWIPALCWVAGYSLAILAILPLLLPAVEGFFASTRSHGVLLEDMQANNIPAQYFPTSLFFGLGLGLVRTPTNPFATYTLALSSCAAAWCLLPALTSPEKWRPLDGLICGLMIFVAVLVCRPLWITEIMAHLPLLRSMRWPFRELLQFQFFLHLLLVTRKPGGTPRMRSLLALFSLSVMVCPFWARLPPPTFNPMRVDRALVLSGGFDRYWNNVRPFFKPTDRVAILIPKNIYFAPGFEGPYSMLSVFDYSCLSHVINVWGYSQTPPLDALYTHTHAFYPYGAFTPEDRESLLAERPGLKFITLESLHPLKITLSSQDGPTIDLTPYAQTELKRIGWTTF